MNETTDRVIDRGASLITADVNAISDQRRPGALILKRGSEQSLAGRRFLIVTPSYEPLTNPRAFRWSAIAKVWASQGALVDVVCCWTPGTDDREIRSGVRVIRVGGGISERIRGALRTPERAAVARQAAPSNSSTAMRMLRRLGRATHDTFWKSIYWPDYACLWIPAALHAARRALRRRRYDALITVSDPFSAHLVGVALKRSYPGLRWTMDLGDPFSFRTDTPANNLSLYASLNKRIERKLFARADVITVTSGATGEKYRELIPNAAHKVTVIGPLATPLESTATTVPTDKTKTLVYVGTLYEKIRNPHFLLQLFSAALRMDNCNYMSLHFYGSYDGCQRFFKSHANLIGKTVFLHGLVSHERALEALRRADVLVNIGNINPYQLPSKLAEYIALCKPIVHVNTAAQDASRELLDDHPNHLNLDAVQGEPTDTQISEFVDFVARAPQEVNRATMRELLERISPESVAAAYAQRCSRSGVAGNR